MCALSKHTNSHLLHIDASSTQVGCNQYYSYETEWIVGKMNCEGHAVALFTGDSTTDQRITMLNRFVEGGGGERLKIGRKNVHEVDLTIN